MPAKQNTRKLTNYLIFMIKIKYKESKIVKKCLGWINLLVVSRGKCNNGIKRENSTYLQEKNYTFQL